MVQSYDYANRQGVRPITWEEFDQLCARLAEQLQERSIEAVVGIARPGLFPATRVAISLRRELYPARITRRYNDEVVHKEPVWITPVSPEVKGKAVAVIDEIADTGRTLELVAQAVRELGARTVITAALACHTWARPQPDLCPLVTDELVIWPWDQKVLVDGQWQLHPEIVEALKLQAPK